MPTLQQELKKVARLKKGSNSKVELVWNYVKDNPDSRPVDLVQAFKTLGLDKQRLSAVLSLGYFNGVFERQDAPAVRSRGRVRDGGYQYTVPPKFKAVDYKCALETAQRRNNPTQTWNPPKVEVVIEPTIVDSTVVQPPREDKKPAIVAEPRGRGRINPDELTLKEAHTLYKELKIYFEGEVK